MEISEYRNIYQNEATHFFYVNTHGTVISFIKKYFTIKSRIKILDAGCGTGLLLKKISPFGQVYGVDNHQEAIALSRKRGLKNVRLASVSSLPFKPETFDLITCIDVLYHKDISSDRKVLKEFYRVLKPGGVLILKNPAYDWLRGHHDSIVHTAHRYTKSELNSKLQRAGFKIKKITYAYTFIFPFVLLKRVSGRFFKNSSSDVEEIPQFLNKLLLTLQTIETRIILIFNLPFGLSIYSVCQKPR